VNVVPECVLLIERDRGAARNADNDGECISLPLDMYLSRGDRPALSGGTGMTQREADRLALMLVDVPKRSDCGVRC
jgi:hypothetical protein